jgi:hypothetical protein
MSEKLPPGVIAFTSDTKSTSSITLAYQGDVFTVLGLVPAMTYYFYPYWDESANAIGWIPGDAGFPPIAHKKGGLGRFSAEQSLPGRIPLGGSMMLTVTTPACPAGRKRGTL